MPASNLNEPDDRARIRAAALEEALAERTTVERGNDKWESGCNACAAAVLALLGRAEK